MNPEQGSLMRVVAHSALTSFFSHRDLYRVLNSLITITLLVRTITVLGRLWVQNMFLRYGLN